MNSYKTIDRNRPADEKVWKEILALSWTPKNRAVLERVRDAGVSGLPYDGQGTKLYKRYQTINAILRIGGSDYRLGSVVKAPKGKADFYKECWYLFYAD